MQESVLASSLLLELFGQEIRRGEPEDAYGSGQNSKHNHAAALFHARATDIKKLKVETI